MILLTFFYTAFIILYLDNNIKILYKNSIKLLNLFTFEGNVI